jgi:hypothetical protein
VLDDVERRRFLVEPAREDPLPAFVRLLDVELNEGARQFLLFPRRRGLAGAQADNDVFPAHRLAGVKRDVLDNPVALVEDTEHRDALGHRRDAAFAIGCRGHLLRSGQWRVLLRLALAARGKRKRDDQRSGGGAHAYSGIQGS